MKYDPKIHHRRSIRMQNYDYSQPGYYFLTVCTHYWLCLFGEIDNGLMELNEAGQMIDKWWKKLNDKFTNVQILDYVIMPNHFHGIVNIVGADPCVCPKDGEHAGLPLQNISMKDIVQWFKTMTTNEYIRNVKEYEWKPFKESLWQRNYYEHIIRNETSLEQIRGYILNNPSQWDQDDYFLKKL